MGGRRVRINHVEKPSQCANSPHVSAARVIKRYEIRNCSVDVEQEAELHRAYYITPQGSEVCADSQA